MTPNPLIAALDTADVERLEWLAQVLAPHVGHLKVGLEAFAAHGPGAVRTAGRYAPVFCDLKLHDIPHTVARATAALARLDVAMLTVHAGGGPAMIAAAVDAAPGVAILAVSVLTSLDEGALAAVGQPPAAEQAPRLAALAVAAGARGVVCAPTEVPAVRQAVGADALVVVPGIRPLGADHGDQARVATPRAAMAAGADCLVVGRPLTSSPDPAAAATALLQQIGWP